MTNRLLIAVLLTFAASNLTAARKTPLQGTPPARLLQLARASATIHVIVGVALDKPWKPAGQLSLAAAEEQGSHHI